MICLHHPLKILGLCGWRMGACRALMGLGLMSVGLMTGVAVMADDDVGDGSAESKGNAVATTLATTLVESIHVPSTVSLGGSVVPYREATLSAQMPGRVEVLAGEEGDEFKKDGLLVALGDDELLARRQQVVAELKSAEAAMRNAGVQYSRELYSPYSINKSPGGMGMPSMMDYFFTRQFSDAMGNSNQKLDRHADLYKQSTRLEQSRNSILQAQSRLREIDAKLRDTRSYAPFDGVIVRKYVELGDTVQPGAPLYKFADLQYLQIKVEVPARLVRGLQKGDYLQARLDADSVIIDVRIAQVFPVADAERHTVTVKFDVPNDAPAAPGMYATVMVSDPSARMRDLVVIPRAALLLQGSLPSVKVINTEGKPELRLVRLGEDLANDRVAVISGLQPGEEVQVQGALPVVKSAHEWGTSSGGNSVGRGSGSVDASARVNRPVSNQSRSRAAFPRSEFSRPEFSRRPSRYGVKTNPSFGNAYDNHGSRDGSRGGIRNGWGQQPQNPFNNSNQANSQRNYASHNQPLYRQDRQKNRYRSAANQRFTNPHYAQQTRQEGMRPSTGSSFGQPSGQQYWGPLSGGEWNKQVPSLQRGNPQSWQPGYTERSPRGSGQGAYRPSQQSPRSNQPTFRPNPLRQRPANAQQAAPQSSYPPATGNALRNNDLGNKGSGNAAGNAYGANQQNEFGNTPTNGIDDNAAGLFGEQRGFRDGGVSR